MGVVLTDVAVAPLICQLEPLDGDLTTVFMISHSALVSGLSEV